jgi:uncharacterized YigZ family protein
MTIPDPVISADAGDEYRTIAAPAEAEIKIVGSRFLAFASPATSPEEAHAVLDALRRTHYDATHHCWAWRLGMTPDAFRFSDDGEPAGTAGRRILTAIDRRTLTDLMLVVVRYFGGTKLGVGGLARAYTDAADAVLDRVTIETRFVLQTFTITFPYDQTSQVHHVLEGMGADITDRRYGDAVTYDLRIRTSRSPALLAHLAEATDRTVVVE